MIAHFLPFFLLHFLTLPEAISTQSKEVDSNFEKTPWPSKSLTATDKSYLNDDLTDWVCATKDTKFAKLNDGIVTIRADGIEIEMEGWINQPNGPNNGKKTIMPIQLLVSKEMKTFTEYKIVDYSNEFPPTSCIVGQDDDEYFRHIKTDTYKNNAPFCKIERPEKEKSHETTFKYSCEKWTGTGITEFRQPKSFTLPAGEKFGIYAISIASETKDPECKTGSMKIFYPSPQYKFLVHKHDLMHGSETENCLNKVESTTTTTTTTTTITTTTTTTTELPTTTTTTETEPPTTTVTDEPSTTVKEEPITDEPESSTSTEIMSSTKWHFQTNRIEFFNGPTPFPPGTVIEMGGWNEKEE